MKQEIEKKVLKLVIWEYLNGNTELDFHEKNNKIDEIMNHTKLNNIMKGLSLSFEQRDEMDIAIGELIFNLIDAITNSELITLKTL
jgi:hypothetical protein